MIFEERTVDISVKCYCSNYLAGFVHFRMKKLMIYTSVLRFYFVCRSMVCGIAYLVDQNICDMDSFSKTVGINWLI